MKPLLHNRINNNELKRRLQYANEPRITLSFYRYHTIADPQALRDELYLQLSKQDAWGRIYVSVEGVNAQVSVPSEKFDAFSKYLYSIPFLNDIRLNIAIEDTGKSFFKLKILVRKKIVADGLPDHVVSVADTAPHLSAEEFNRLTDRSDTLVVDMRNHYESEVGRFRNALCPDADTFRDAIPLVEKMLKGKEERPIVMYCTGGIRCEKASAWFRQKGFKNVFQLDGGIVEYARQVREKGLENKFIGKNFVFDERLGEQISPEVISHCHQCGASSNRHTNCKNDACHLLFIQCPQCAEKFDGCCSNACKNVASLPPEQQKEQRKRTIKEQNVFRKGRFNPERLR